MDTLVVTEVNHQNLSSISDAEFFESAALLMMACPAPQLFVIALSASYSRWAEVSLGNSGATGHGSSLAFLITGETIPAFWLGYSASPNTTFEHSLNQEGSIEL